MPATLQVLDVIGLWGVQAADFSAQLAAVKSRTLNLEINSPGGDFFAGLSIFNMLRQSGKTITTKVMGIAASAAALVAMAGDTIEMPENTFLMVHRTGTSAAGNATVMRDTAALLDKLDVSMTDIFVRKTGMSVDSMRALLETDTWLSAAEAVEKGFATKVTGAISARASFATAHANLPSRVTASLKSSLSSVPTSSDIWATRNNQGKK